MPPKKKNQYVPRILSDSEKTVCFEFYMKKQFAILEKKYLTKNADLEFLPKQIAATQCKYRITQRIIKKQLEFYYPKGALFTVVRYYDNGYFRMVFRDWQQDKEVEVLFYADCAGAFMKKFYGFYHRFKEMPVLKLPSPVWKGKLSRQIAIRKAIEAGLRVV